MATSRKPTKKPPAPMTVTEYWEAVAALVQEIEDKESEFKDLATDAAYKTAKEVIREMASEGINLESTGTGDLDALGKKILKIRGKFKKPNEIPEIGGAASHALAVGYAELLTHFGEAKVSTPNTALQLGLSYRIPFKTSKSGYNDAKDGAAALKIAIAAWEKEHAAELKNTQPVPPADVTETKATEAKQSVTTPPASDTTTPKAQAASTAPAEAKQEPTHAEAKVATASMPKSLLQQITDGENPKMTVTQYWQAVSDLLADLKQREKRGEFGTPEDVKKDTEYKTIRESFQKTADLGLTLESNPSAFTLMSMGKQRWNFKKTDSQSVPRITGAASYAFVESYQRLASHFGRSWSLTENKNNAQMESVTSSNQDLQKALREKSRHYGATVNPLYQEIALDGVVLAEILSQNPQHKPKAAEQPPPVPKAPENKQEAKTPTALQEQISALHKKIEQAREARDAINKQLKTFQELSSFFDHGLPIFFEEKKTTTALPVIPVAAADNLESLSAALDQFAKSEELKKLGSMMQTLEGKSGEAKLRGQIEAQLKYLYDEDTPSTPSEDIYKSLQRNLSEESQKAWGDRLKTASRRDVTSYGGGTEGFHRRALAGILAAELSSRAKAIHAQSTAFSQMNIGQDLQALKELRVQHAHAVALAEFESQVGLNQIPYHAVKTYLERKPDMKSILDTTDLFRNLNKLKPDDIKEAKLSSIKKFGEMKNVSLSDVQRLLYQTSCAEVTKFLTDDKSKLEEKELSGALQNIHAALATPDNPEALAKLDKTIDMLAKKNMKGPTIGQKFRGAIMMWQGKRKGNETLYKKGWSLRTGYDAGQYELKAALTWLQKSKPKTKTPAPAKESKKNMGRTR